MPISFVLLLVSFWNRNDLAEDIFIIDELTKDPVQNKIDMTAFDVKVNEIEYRIQPLYEYELHGLVVSYELHDGNYNLHKRWNDHLNVADYCVVWKDNASNRHLNKINFWNGQFTCNFSTRNRAAWESFNENQISNNHLISDDKSIRKRLRKINIGDQIHLKGWLSSYKNLKTGNERGTSITREDKGNGACETIYVNDANILQSYNSIWRILVYMFSAVFIVSLVLYFMSPHRIRN